MISCFVGRPGQGKTLTMMHFLTEDLIRTERFIVTNIPLKLPELAEYLQRTCENRRLRVPDINKRLLQISTEEALFFWRYRAGQLVLPEWDGKDKNGKLLPEEDLLAESSKYWRQIGDSEKTSAPVTYYISEAHRYFNAKRFQRVSVIAELYITHHRHLHDEVFFDTQYPGQLAVALRELTEEWHVLRNDYNRVIGVVKMIPRIRMRSFYEIPSGSNQPFEKRSVYIQEDGCANCYESTGALGAINRTMQTEEKKKAKGIPFKVFVTTLVIIIVTLSMSLAVIPRMLTKKVTGGITPGQVKPTETPQRKSMLQPISQGTQAPAPAPAPAPVDPYIGVSLVSFRAAETSSGLWLRAELSNGELINQYSEGLQGVSIPDGYIRYKGKSFVYIPVYPEINTKHNERSS